MNLVVFLRLIRFKNLLLICYVFTLLKFFLFPSFGATTLLTDFQFFILLIATLLITASGYIINDIFDVEADKINKSKKIIVSKIISLEKAKRIYFFMNVSGIILGIWLTLQIQKPNLAFVFIVASLLLYYYSKTLQKKALLGNLLVSLLIAFSVFLPVLFEIQNSNKQVISLVLALSVFSFFLNLSREILKDITDIKGDYNSKLKTLPIILGVKRSCYLAALFSLIPTVFLIYLIISIKSDFEFSRTYLLISCALPLIYVITKLVKSTSYRMLKKLSSLLKIIMFLGITSILLISYNL